MYTYKHIYTYNICIWNERNDLTRWWNIKVRDEKWKKKFLSKANNIFKIYYPAIHAFQFYFVSYLNPFHALYESYVMVKKLFGVNTPMKHDTCSILYSKLFFSFFTPHNPRSILTGFLSLYTCIFFFPFPSNASLLANAPFLSPLYSLFPFLWLNINPRARSSTTTLPAATTRSHYCFTSSSPFSHTLYILRPRAPNVTLSPVSPNGILSHQCCIHTKKKKNKEKKNS